MSSSDTSQPSPIMESIEKQLETLEIRPPSNQDPDYYRVVAHMSAFGGSKEDIATGLGRPIKDIEEVLSLDRIQDLIFQTKKKFAGRDYDRLFKLMVPDAADVVQKIMADKTAKDATRLNAALAVVDRAMGKPLQKVEHRGSIIHELFERLDHFEDLHKNRMIESDLKAKHNKSSGEQNSDAIDAEFHTEKEPADKISDWVEENIK